jgi:hypothetical protein
MGCLKGYIFHFLDYLLYITGWRDGGSGGMEGLEGEKEF